MPASSDSRPCVRVAGLALALSVALAASCSSDPLDRGDGFDTEFLKTEEKLYSQEREEVVIRHFFKDRRLGFFLDVGSYHWKQLSTTLYLEDHLGWRGIAVDANGAWATGYAKNRHGTRFRNFLVGDRDDEDAILYIQPTAPATASVSREWVETLRDAFNPKEEGKSEEEIKRMRVRTITLNTLLDSLEVERIDFLSMDIEGYELPALRGFDIERYAPELVCIELGGETFDAVFAWFEEHGYEPLRYYREYDRVNWYFARRAAS